MLLWSKKKIKNYEIAYEEYQPIIFSSSTQRIENVFGYMSSDYRGFINLNREQLFTLIKDNRFDCFNLFYVYKNQITPLEFFRNIFDLCKIANEKDCKMNLLIVQETKNKLDNCYISSIIGFANSLIKENHSINIKLLNMSNINIDSLHHLYSYLFESIENEFKYDVTNNKLYVKRIRKYSGSYNFMPIKNQGVYVIIGGGIISRKIAQKIKSYGGLPIILSRKKVKEYNSYILDARNYNLLSNVFKDIVKKYDSIDGIFNLAAITKDKLFYFKEYEEFLEVLNTKALTTINIIRCVSENKFFTDFLVNFSSLVSVFGNIGQTDYSMANRFLDNACYLKSPYIKKIRTVNWPYWKDGGMRLSNNQIGKMIEETKQHPISDEDALNILFGLEAIDLTGNEIIFLKNTLK